MKCVTYAEVIRIGSSLGLILDPADKAVYAKTLEEAYSKKKRVKAMFQTETKDRTDPQLRLYWALVTLVLKVVNGRAPTEEERMEYHEDLKARYANRRPSRLHPEVLVPIGMSDGDISDAGALIDGVYQDLFDLDLSTKQQSEAKDLWKQYWEMGGQRYKDEKDFRNRAKICCACGSGESIERAHIQSRGANHARIEDPTNYLPLCTKCHKEQHQHGVEEFLRKYPHLENRWRES